MKASKRKAVAVLVSGGLDSVALLGRLAKQYRQVYPIYIRQGLRWEKTELHWLTRFLRETRLGSELSLSHAPPAGPAFAERDILSSDPRRVSFCGLVVLDMPMADVYGGHWSLTGQSVPGARSPDRAVYLPGRNMLLSLKAAVFCAQRGIPTLAIGSLDHNPFPDASTAFFRQWSKALSMGLGASIQLIAPLRQQSKADVIRAAGNLPLELSFSCIQPRGRRHCGRCNKCAERKKAFREAGIEDRTAYAN